MTGNTHVSIGIASSLIILQPQTVPECLCAMAGGMVGGMISDIDSSAKRNSMDLRNDPYAWQIYVFIGIALAVILGLDYISGDGAVDYMINNLDIQMLVGLVSFLGLCFFGSTTYHRTFTHSFLAGVLFTASVWCFCKPLAIPFAIGFATHLFLDFFNRKKVTYLWPLRFKIGLNRFPSNGRLNEALDGIGTIASIYLFTYFFLNSFVGSRLAVNIMDFFSREIAFKKISLPFIVPYLVIINIIGFIAYILDYVLYMGGLLYYKGSDEEANIMSEFIMTLLLTIDLAGGMVGKLIAVFLLQKGKIYKAEELANFNLYIIPVCFLISWLVIIFTFFLPSVSVHVQPLPIIVVRGIPLYYIVFSYFFIINFITMLLFPKMKRFAKIITPREKLCMFLSFLGGASGGYFSIKLTGNHENTTMLLSSLPEMIIMHAIVLSCFFYIM